MKMALLMVSDADNPLDIPQVSGKEGSVDFVAVMPIDIDQSIEGDLLIYGRTPQVRSISPETKEVIRRVRKILSAILKQG